jgi:pyruvate/2-oxoglutarate/acetoin dehydrogenase E1 component
MFLGQAVAFPGTAMSRTFKDVFPGKLLELPVAEDMQLGMATGMAIDGMLPIAIYPRWNFLLLATNQLVLHLDKLPEYSRGGFWPRVIIRTSVATPAPLNPGPQHLGDFTRPYQHMVHNILIEELHEAAEVVPAYKRAMERKASTILVEYARNYA